jgi:LacI family transcriptional regulator
MLRRPHVVLMIDTRGVYGRRILSGISRYLRSTQPWSISLDLRKLDGCPPRLRHWRGDGIICRAIAPRFAEYLRRTCIPAINLNDITDGLRLPLLRSDDLAIGRLAAEHLLARGFRSFAFCGYTRQGWSRRRREGFVAAVERREGQFHGSYESLWESDPSSQRWTKEQDALSRWLERLPRPLGVLACNDLRGQHVLAACQRLGMAVPQEVAVVGVDDDVRLCELCNPPLSSVRPNAERIGYEAAALLERLMAGEKLSQQEWLIVPLGVTVCQSTDVLLLDNPDVAAALRYIHKHACQGIAVQDVLKRVPLSRTKLEGLFRKYLGHSPRAEIRIVQVEQAKRLLVTTDLSLERIAELTGHSYPEYLSVMFKRLTGKTPSEYRHQIGTGTDPLQAS